MRIILVMEHSLLHLITVQYESGTYDQAYIKAVLPGGVERILCNSFKAGDVLSGSLIYKLLANDQVKFYLGVVAPSAGGQFGVNARNNFIGATYHRLIP